jgi:hypothetical protein
MVIVASIYLRYYIEVGVGTFLPTLTPQPCSQLWQPWHLVVCFGRPCSFPLWSWTVSSAELLMRVYPNNWCHITEDSQYDINSVIETRNCHTLYLLYKFLYTLYNMFVEFNGLNGTSCDGCHFCFGNWRFDFVQCGELQNKFETSINIQDHTHESKES